MMTTIEQRDAADNDVRESRTVHAYADINRDGVIRPGMVAYCGYVATDINPCPTSRPRGTAALNERAMCVVCAAIHEHRP